LAPFEQWAKTQLARSMLLHADETGINSGGKRHWWHCASSATMTLFYPHAKRGTEAMDEMGILPFFKGVLCHDHWKPYYHYKALHALCNAHHLRELERAWEQDHQQWAKEMQAFLIDLSKEEDVLRFMEVESVPFTNNQGENDLRMTKVQQKISGCFRSIEGAKIFCRVRSYLSTCRKHGMTATQALTLLFQGKNPAFMETE
jgi:transposase-like protein